MPTPFSDSSKTYKGRLLKFTLRYRTNNDQPWQWVREQFGMADGEIILQPPIDPNWVSASPVELVSGWNTRKVHSDSPEARLYYIESTHPMARPDSNNATYQSKVLGKVTLCSRFFALVRIWSPWLAPRHGTSHFNITEDAVCCSFLRTDGRHVVILAVNGVDEIITVFRSNEAGDIVVASRNDTTKDGKFRLLAATAWDFEVAMGAVLYEMRKMVRVGSTSTAPSRRPSQPAEPVGRSSGQQHIRINSIDSDPDALLVSRAAELSLTDGSSSDEPAFTPRWMEDWYDNLAFCTWNSLGQDLTPDRIMEALDSLAAHGIKVSSLIIDDNWQSLEPGKDTGQNERRMTRFEANSQFPGGLKTLTSQIRKKFPWIRDIAVWHALCGYWGGISPDGEIAKDYQTMLVKMDPVNGFAPKPMTIIHSDDVHRWYDDFYKFLSESGVTGVKTDAQFIIDRLTDTPDRRAVIGTYQSAWTQAHLSHFAGKAISCMSCIPQILYHSFLPTDKPQILLRNSDDFFPGIPESHAWHIFCNAHNTLLVRHLNALPDWDMFQTVHDFSDFHAAARCLSGGPIYITDTPGEHDVDLISQITARGIRNGESVLLRPSTIAKTQSIYEKYEEGHILKVGVWNGRAEVGTSMLGVFNIGKEEKSFVIPITDFQGIETSTQDQNPTSCGSNWDDVPAQRHTRWIFRSHVSKRVSQPMTPLPVLGPDQLLQGELSVRGWDIWSAIPVHKIQLSDELAPTEVAVLGLMGKMTGSVAIIESQCSVVDGEKRTKVGVHLKALGTLGVWVSHGIEVENMMVLLQGKPISKHRVKVEPVQDWQEHDLREESRTTTDNEHAVVVSIDVEGSWDDLEINPGWSNEVWVEVYFG